MRYKLTNLFLDKFFIPSNSLGKLTKFTYWGKLSSGFWPLKSIPCLLGWPPKALPTTAANVLKGVYVPPFNLRVLGNWTDKG